MQLESVLPERAAKPTVSYLDTCAAIVFLFSFGWTFFSTTHFMEPFSL